MNCPICQAQNEEILWQNEDLRIIVVNEDANVPAFCRVIWQSHQAEMTDLNETQRAVLMNAVYHTESAMREVLRPTKINLASLGNMVPHLHWHVIARFDCDAYFPAPIWANAQRENTLRLPENWTEQVKNILAQKLV